MHGPCWLLRLLSRGQGGPTLVLLSLSISVWHTLPQLMLSVVAVCQTIIEVHQPQMLHALLLYE